MDPRGPVVLAVIDDDLDPALGFAVAEATRHGCGLRLVGHDAAMLRRVRARVVGVPVEDRLVCGPPVRSVLDASGDARLVVVRRRDLLYLIRAVTAADNVLPTSWADPAIACVPPSWSAPAGRDLPTTVGVEETEQTEELVERARAVCGPSPVQPVHTSHARAGTELVERSARSRLLVLGRNAVDQRGGTRLGRTARTVLHDSGCPVVLLPPS